MGRHLTNQKVTGEWAIRCFGPKEAKSIVQRGIRTGEEFIELMQVCGVPEKMLYLMIKDIYKKPVGEMRQEIGGCRLTLLALCEALGISAQTCEDDEIARVLSKPVEHFRARNKAKCDAGYIAEDLKDEYVEPVAE